MQKTFEIYFGDLNEASQEALCEEFGTTEEDENWEYQPIAIIEREMEERHECNQG